MTKSTSVPTAFGDSAADFKAPEGGGGVDAEYAPVLLSPAVKHQIQNIVSQFAADKVAFSPDEFRAFLEKKQKVLEPSGLVEMG